ncbi:MAG: M48 family metalloprotease, partial [Planctomycetota bacterium]
MSLAGPHFKVLALLNALLLVGCCTDPVNGEKFFCTMTESQEAQIGAEYAPNFIAENGGLYPDQELQDHLRKIVIENMAKKSHRPQLPWEFSLLNTSQINAFALPGGKVFVTRGLISKLESEAQFAHLMGHEIGHVSHRHAARGQGRNALYVLLVGAAVAADQQLSDPDDPPIISTTVGALGFLTLLKFSRDQELQADQRGVDYAILAGYDPREGR